MEPAHQRLVDGLVAAGHLRSQPLVSAFAAVPRHLFVPRAFRRTSTGEFGAIDSGAPSWLDLVYADIPLTTQVDGDDELWDTARHEPVTGMPTSSSSQPSLMAQMLEALDLRDGHRVLEVGTGTGYNAALLAHRLGDGGVFTVEVDTGVAEAAQGNLRQAGYAPTEVAGDGAQGYEAGAPYDRIIATYSVASIPPAWVEQTRRGGLIEASLYRPLGGARLVLLSVADGAAQGRFLPGGGGFMPTRDQTTPVALPLLKMALQHEDADHETRPTMLANDVLDHAHLGMLIALKLDDVTTIEFQPVGGGTQRWLFAGRDAWARLDAATGTVSQHGHRRLWDELESIHDAWQTAGQPTRDRYGLTVDDDGEPWLWLDRPDQQA